MGKSKRKKARVGTEKKEGKNYRLEETE